MSSLWQTVSENVVFVLEFLALIVVMFLIAYVIEKAVKKKNNDTERVLATRKIVVIGVFSAIAAILMVLEFPVPFAPSFYGLDFSELPALIAAFTLGPVSGVAVCFVKNLVLLSQTITGGVGELSNFIIGSAFVVPAGLIYRHHRNYGGAIVGSVVGALLMAVLGFFSNLFIIYPIYTNVMPMEAIMGMYQAINPSVQELWQALLIFNLPFTFCKGLISAVITILVYKKLEPVINGKVV